MMLNVFRSMLAFSLSCVGVAMAVAAEPPSACGYDVSAFRGQLGAPLRESVGTSGIRIQYVLSTSQKSGSLQGTLTFNCNSTTGTPVAAVEPAAAVMSPKELIAQEDAGGRYGRHVAWQRTVKAPNWSPQVAFVDYTLGDGQRIRGNDFLVCDREVARPCIALSITRPKKLSSKDIAEVLSMIGSISIQHCPVRYPRDRPATEAASPPAEDTSPVAGYPPTVGLSSPRPAPTLCDPNEAAVFSCTLRQGKIASVCAAKLADGQWQLTYVFGRKNNREITLTRTTGNAPYLLEGWDASGNQGGIKFLRFRVDDYAYVPYVSWAEFTDDDKRCRDNRPPCWDAGVAVEQAGETIQVLRCVPESIPWTPVNIFENYKIPKSQDAPRLDVPSHR